STNWTGRERRRTESRNGEDARLDHFFGACRQTALVPGAGNRLDGLFLLSADDGLPLDVLRFVLGHYRSRLGAFAPRLSQVLTKQYVHYLGESIRRYRQQTLKPVFDPIAGLVREFAPMTQDCRRFEPLARAHAVPRFPWSTSRRKYARVQIQQRACRYETHQRAGLHGRDVDEERAKWNEQR